MIMPSLENEALTFRGIARTERVLGLALDFAHKDYPKSTSPDKVYCVVSMQGSICSKMFDVYDPSICVPFFHSSDFAMLLLCTTYVSLLDRVTLAQPLLAVFSSPRGDNYSPCQCRYTIDAASGGNDGNVTQGSGHHCQQHGSRPLLPSLRWEHQHIVSAIGCIGKSPLSKQT